MAELKRDFLPEHLEPLLRARGYAGCVAVQAAHSLDETRFLLAQAERHSFVKGVVGWVDLRDPEAAAVLADLAADFRLKGIRHIAQDEPDDRFLTNQSFARGVALLERFGLAYDLLVFPRQLPAAIELARRFPVQRFVLDHIAKPEIKTGRLSPWREQMRELAAAPNVSCKLSGMVTEADWSDWRPEQLRPYLDVAFEAFGPARLMIGSDWPVCLLAGDYDRVMGVVEDYVSRLSEAEREAVLGGNAARFYRLDEGQA